MSRLGHPILGLASLPSALRRGTTAAPQGADIWIDTAGDLTIVNNATVSGNLVVSGTTTIVGAQTYTGLLTVTSSTGGGAAGALGPEELRVDMTQAATAGATIRNPGYLNFQGRYWETTGGTSTTQRVGSIGMVVDTITAATGAPLTYRHVFTDAAGTIIASITEAGRVRAGAGSAALPSLTVSDNGSGFYRVGADSIGVSLSGASRWTWLSGGDFESSSASIYTGDGAVSPVAVGFQLNKNTGMFRPATNAVGFSAAGVEVGRFDNSSTADDMRVLLYDVTGASLKRVSRGAADSGGTGFRLLRVAN